MADLFQIAGAASPPSEFAPLHVNRMVTGFWTNTNPLRDAATSAYIEKAYGGRQDRIAAGINTEISPRLTLRRRSGLSVYNSQLFPAINRFYGWNTFTTNSEFVRVMADCGGGGGAVYDATGPNTKTLIHTKAAGAGKTFFLGVGNTLYMTNGVENLQLDNATGKVTNWGIAAPTSQPYVSQTPITNPYPAWQPNTAYGSLVAGMIIIYDASTNTMQFCNKLGTTGATKPLTFGANRGDVTPDGTTSWFCLGTADWRASFTYANAQYAIYVNLNVSSGLVPMTFSLRTQGISGPNPPQWLAGLGSQVVDGTCVWQNVGPRRDWTNIGANISCLPGVNNPAVDGYQILDPNGYVQTAMQTGLSSPLRPDFSTSVGALTLDSGQTWRNTMAYAVASTAPRQYGYAFYSSLSKDLSNMSPASAPISVIADQQVIVTGQGSQDSQVDTVVIYRTAQGGSTFFELARIPITLGASWSYTDSAPDSALNSDLQAQVNGEGTPLPAGATCMEYNYGRIWVAVKNVVYASSGPDGVVSGSSGNAGFDMTFTAQSRIIRFWVTPIGLLVFTVRDCYIITGNGAPASVGGTPFTMTKYVENVPLLNYDSFSVFLTTAYFLSGSRMIKAFDPSAGILEASFPIADQITAMDPKNAYVTFHVGGSGETALYIGDGRAFWYRMAPTSAPETGMNWNPPAYPVGGMSAIQSVEVLPGTYQFLVGPFVGNDPINNPNMAPILRRDATVNTDNGHAFSAYADVGNIVLAHSGQLAGLAWITLESAGQGSATKLFVLLDEINELPQANLLFFPVLRSRQDPPNAPPIESYYSNRHSLLQSQKLAWCRSIKLRFEWPIEDAANELLTYTIFGQTWAEQRSQ